MVRTRGNISRRGSNDAPESSRQGAARKRPTASTRRRGQHEANVVEDDIVENEVPDVPREDEQVIDNDGGGFPGGPYDTSLLTQYQDHVARMIWDGQDRDVKVVSHIKKVKKLGRPHPAIAHFVLASGLSPLCDILYEYIDLGLVLGFVERWHPETNTFHLPIGEMTITLDDVWSLLHLSISGNFCSTENLEYEDSVQILTTLLGVDRAMACVELNQSRGAQVRLSWLRDLYHSCCENELWEFAARAYLLHLVGCTIFANKSATYVPRRCQLCKYKAISWISTSSAGLDIRALPYIGKEASTGYICGDEPRALRYVTGRAISAIADVRVQLDGLTYDGMIWNPYVAHRAARQLVTHGMFSGFLRVGTVVQRHLPERVLRQFGFIQPIPRPPSSVPMMDFEAIDDRWKKHEQFVVHQVVQAPAPFSCSDGYLQWFRRVSHPYILRGAEADRPSLVLVPRLRRNLPDDITVQRTSPSSSSSGLLGLVKRIVGGLQRMIDCRDVTEGTVAWDRTHELLQMAQDGVEEEETRGGRRVRGRRPSTSG
ncbi:protein MAIN-LIKE 1-like [Vigna unguiculata]|uniref:protein MAIN-LIKE 1-like n=1 Tax=Vigna unguiculata TaxID=3917 RepID=UPI00101652D2|nr:protein MAIN-LIKE 1-like [Vigna unguiculata]